MRLLANPVRRLLLCLAVICLACASAKADVAGDVAIIGFNFDDPDELAFVTLVAQPAGKVISFTDNGWRSPEEVFRLGEGTATFTVPGGGLAAGTIVAGPIGTMAFSTAGDQIFAFNGTINGTTGTLTGTLLYGLNSEGAGVWQATASSSNTSALPAALASANVALNEVDNAIFDTSVLSSGTAAQWLAEINDSSNWLVNDATRFTMPSGSLNVVVPEPAAASALVACLGLLLRRRRA